MPKLKLNNLAQNQQYLLFGKLASGLFHELASPLTALGILLNQLQTDKILDLHSKQHLDEAISVTKKLENLLNLTTTITQGDNSKRKFSLNKQIQNSIQLFSFESKKSGVSIFFEANAKVSIHGFPTQFNQLIQILLSNAIKNCSIKTKANNKILIQLMTRRNKAMIIVKDSNSITRLTLPIK